MLASSVLPEEKSCERLFTWGKKINRVTDILSKLDSDPSNLIPRCYS